MLNLTQCLRRAQQLAPGRAATIFQDRQRSWQEVYDRVGKLAGGLMSLGIAPGDRVALLALNSDNYLECYYACWWLGAIIVPLNTRWNVNENAYAMNNCEPDVLLIDGNFMPQLAALREQVPSIREIVCMDTSDVPSACHDYEALIADSDPIPDALMKGDDIAGIFYTGGTTGFPKGVMLTNESLYISALGGLASGVSQFSDYSFLHSAPMFHLADAGYVVAGTTLAGTHVMLDQFTPRGTLQVIQDHGVQHGVFVPAMLGMLLQDPDFDSFDLSSFRRVSYGASPMPVALLKEAMRRLPNAEFIQGYGQTELSPLATVLMPEDHILEGPGSERLASAGRPLPHCEVEIVDEELKPLPRGEIGQVRVRGSNAMKGYWKNPQATAETIVDGWVLTGDAGYMDDDGYLFLVDRVKDMIVTGGENVYSVEVENAIMDHGGIAQCAVIGIPHDTWVEAVHAFVVPKPGQTPTEAEIIAHCRELIATYKCPRTIEFRSEPLPLSGAGKVLKRELREQYLK